MHCHDPNRAGQITLIKGTQVSLYPCHIEGTLVSYSVILKRQNNAMCPV